LFGKNIPERRKMLVGGDGGRELRIEHGEWRIKKCGQVARCRTKGWREDQKAEDKELENRPVQANGELRMENGEWKEPPRPKNGHASFVRRGA
jgi:hypothetical protein